MKYEEILNKWAEYTDYNKDQTKFNMLDYSFELHQVNERIGRIMKNYDETGALAIIQAKIMFEKILKKISYNAFEYMENPNIIKREKEIWDMFHCKEVLEIENSYINSIDQLSNKVIGRTLIGKRNDKDMLNDLFDATDIVLNSLEKCNVDLFIRGGEILPITNISTRIHLFETLAECLTILENTNDGLSLCYINYGGSADGYFSFFLKSNGNLLSINERIDEAYVGQHSHCRNGHWTEAKKDELFPYNYIFNYVNHDYKEYATNYLIDDKKLEFFKLGRKVYLPIIVAMIMINKQYTGKTFNDMDIKFVDSLLSCNIKKIAESNNKLIVMNNSSLINSHNNIDLSFDLKKIMTGDYSEEFNYGNNKDYKESGTFTNSNQIFVDLWGKDFEYDSSKIYETNAILRITDKDSEMNNISSEFVGTKKRMRLQGYYKIREQLADFIRNKMHNEWVAFGKTLAVKRWYLEHINKNMDKIERLVIEKYLKIQSGEKSLEINMHTTDSDILDIYYIERRYPEGWGNIILNKRKDNYGNKYYCMQTGAICSMFFTFAPKDWRQLEILCGCEVPKIVKGWNIDGHFGDGNPILEATDMVTEVGTPFEKYESNRYKELYDEHDAVRFDFKFSIGYSKRGLKQILKKYQEV